MFFRATRREGEPRSASATLGRTPIVPTSGIPNNGDGTPTLTPTPPRFSRPVSASEVSRDDLEHVEQRLKIIKRSRASRKQNFAQVASNSENIPELIPAVTPPCPAYPVCPNSRLPKHDQRILEDLAGDCLDVLFFPGGV